MPPLIRTPYDGLESLVSDESAIDFTVKKDEDGKVLNPEVLSLTRQAEKDACDINAIVRRAESAGISLYELSTLRGELMYGDFTQFGSMLDVHNRVAKISNEFSLLPSEIRMRFNNDVRRFVDYLADPANHKEAVSLKLLPADVLKTALADDGVTRITPEDRAKLDQEKAKAAQAAAAGGGNAT